MSKEESSCDMSGVKLQSIKIEWVVLLKILGHRLPFCWWHFDFKLTWSKFLDDDVSNLAKLVARDIRSPNYYLLELYGLPIEVAHLALSQHVRLRGLNLKKSC